VPLPLAQSRTPLRAALHIAPAQRIVDAPRAVALWHLFSLDAPAVAVAWSLGFAWAEDLHLRWPIPLALALTTWTIYIGDRLLDARTAMRSSAKTSLRERHFFVWRHRSFLAPMAAGAACCAAAIAVAAVPSIVFEHGVLVAAASLAYFYGVHVLTKREAARFWALLPTRLVKKELFAALLITAGCILPSWSLFHDTAEKSSAIWLLWIPCLYLAGLMWLNCWCIEMWESMPAESRQWRTRSGRSARTTPDPFEAAALLGLCGLVLSFLAPAAQQRSAELLAAGSASALLLALLDRLRFRMTPLALRAAADLVMLTPLFLILR
jgi:hypothetical protein